MQSSRTPSSTGSALTLAHSLSINSFLIYSPIKGRDLGLIDTESGAHAKTVGSVVGVGAPVVGDKSEVRTADNTAKPPGGAIADARMVMLEQRKLTFVNANIVSVSCSCLVAPRS